MDLIKPINLFNGLNINPIPLEFTQGLTTTEWLGAIQGKVNELINSINNMYSVVSGETDNKIEIAKNNILSSLYQTNTTISKVIQRVEVLEEEKKLAQEVNDYVRNTLEPLWNRQISNMNSHISVLQQSHYKLEQEFVNKYNELIELINQGNYNCYSPYNGNYVSIEQALKDVVTVVQGIHGVPWNTLKSICSSNKITWNMLTTNYKNGVHWNTWNALTYYGCVSLEEYCVNTDTQTPISFQNTPMFVSLNSKFLNK